MGGLINRAVRLTVDQSEGILGVEPDFVGADPDS